MTDATTIRNKAWQTRRAKYGTDGHAPGAYGRTDTHTACQCEADLLRHQARLAMTENAELKAENARLVLEIADLQLDLRLARRGVTVARGNTDAH